MKKGDKKPNSIKDKIFKILSEIPINSKIHKLTLVEEIYGEDYDNFQVRSFDAIKCQVLKNTGLKFSSKGGFLTRIS